ncbi:MAG TPA: GGDEF domain-containing protein [Vicinamibacterales bacterium]|nr:GGDEF domain-containing protein [Vicinamibacterales bacterium]
MGQSRPQKVTISESASDLPGTRAELQTWIRERLRLAPDAESALFAAIDQVITRQERLWQESKDDAIRALLDGFAERMTALKNEIVERDATVTNISHYFERLVGDLTDKTRRDPKTKLMNFGRFMEQLESFLALEQRTRWCAVGLVDITAFKWYNDALGHAVGDRIIERVASILGEQIRSDDLIAVESGRGKSRDLHARLGGDEFCFLIPDLADYGVAWLIAERFRDAVERFDWTQEDPRLEVHPVRVDVGVICLAMGPVSERRHIARRLAHELIDRADKLMYDAKGERASHTFATRVRLERGRLVEIPNDETV